MIQRVCDRCKKVISGTTTYHICISAEDIDPIGNSVSTTTAVRNLSNAMDVMTKPKKDFCEDCIGEIRRCIEGVVDNG